MRVVYTITLILSLTVLVFGYPSNLSNNYAANPPNYNSCHNCHDSYAINSGSGSLVISGLPANGYIAGTTYSLRLDIEHEGKRRWGFQLTAECNPGGQWIQGGQLIRTDPTHTSLSNGTGNNPDFLKNTYSGTYNGQYNFASWDFAWEAPTSGETVTFYVSGLACNGTGGTSSDYVYNISLDVMMQLTTVPDVEISLSPNGTPIQIPAIGGAFEFNIVGSNSEINPITLDCWTMVTLPGGSTFGPIIAIDNLTIQPGAAIDRDRIQDVPASAPTGTYTYHAYIGYYPNTIWDEDSFEFEKLSSSVNRNEISAIAYPDGSHLLSAYPNPFNPATEITFALSDAGKISLLIYNNRGLEIAKLADGFYAAGMHKITFNASDLPSGVYFACMTVNGDQHVRRLLLIK